MTRYFCEAEFDGLEDWERELLGLLAQEVRADCDRPATRHIEVLKNFPLQYEVKEEHFLCHKHTLQWLAKPSNRKTMHTIASLQYHGASVASWIGPNGEDGSIPPC